MKSISVKGYKVKIYNDGEVRIFTKDNDDMDEDKVLVIAKYLYEEGFVDDDKEEVYINIISK